MDREKSFFHPTWHHLQSMGIDIPDSRWWERCFLACHSWLLLDRWMYGIWLFVLCEWMILVEILYLLLVSNNGFCCTSCAGRFGLLTPVRCQPICFLRFWTSQKSKIWKGRFSFDIWSISIQIMYYNYSNTLKAIMSRFQFSGTARKKLNGSAGYLA